MNSVTEHTLLSQTDEKNEMITGVRNWRSDAWVSSVAPISVTMTKSVSKFVYLCDSQFVAINQIQRRNIKCIPMFPKLKTTDEI
jgi:hypothetical protein